MHNRSLALIARRSDRKTAEKGTGFSRSGGDGHDGRVKAARNYLRFPYIGNYSGRIKYPANGGILF